MNWLTRNNRPQAVVPLGLRFLSSKNDIIPRHVIIPRLANGDDVHFLRTALRELRGDMTDDELVRAHGCVLQVRERDTSWFPAALRRSIETRVFPLMAPRNCRRLLNAQFIVKPPGFGSATAFAAHRDEDAMRAYGMEAEARDFFSLWIVLDEVEGENGGHLAFDGEAPLPAFQAGDAVLIPSNVLHSSLPNRSRRERRAFMPQFCE